MATVIVSSISQLSDTAAGSLTQTDPSLLCPPSLDLASFSTFFDKPHENFLEENIGVLWSELFTIHEFYVRKAPLMLNSSTEDRLQSGSYGSGSARSLLVLQTLIQKKDSLGGTLMTNSELRSVAWSDHLNGRCFPAQEGRIFASKLGSCITQTAKTRRLEVFRARSPSSSSQCLSQFVFATHHIPTVTNICDHRLHHMSFENLFFTPKMAPGRLRKTWSYSTTPRAKSGTAPSSNSSSRNVPPLSTNRQISLCGCADLERHVRTLV